MRKQNWIIFKKRSNFIRRNNSYEINKLITKDRDSKNIYYSIKSNFLFFLSWFYMIVQWNLKEKKLYEFLIEFSKPEMSFSNLFCIFLRYKTKQIIIATKIINLQKMKNHLYFIYL